MGGAPEADGSQAREISVSTITLDELFDQFGTPYYAKCDIEAADTLFANQLLRSSRRPTYVSIEMTQLEDLAMLRGAGYTHFQIVNQYLNPSTKPPQPAREGTYINTNFTHHTSGLFGLELPEDGWRDFNETARMILDWQDLRRRHVGLAIGWLDVHARFG